PRPPRISTLFPYTTLFRSLDEHFSDLECLFPRGWLADKQALQVHAQAFSPARVEGMLCVNEGRHAALLLGVGHGVERDRRFAARDRKSTRLNSSHVEISYA